MRSIIAGALFLSCSVAWAQAPAPSGMDVSQDSNTGGGGGGANGHGGAFGLRANFTGGFAGIGTTVAPTVGFAYFATDSLNIIFDAGFAVGTAAGQTVYGLGVDAAIQYYLSPGSHKLRPFLTGGLSFDKHIDNGANSLFDLGILAGFGAEYWLSPSFSVNGRALLTIPIEFGGGGSANVVVATVTPGIGATFWF